MIKFMDALLAWMRTMSDSLPQFTVVLWFRRESDMRLVEAMMQKEFEPMTRFGVAAAEGMKQTPMIRTIMGVPFELQCEEVNWRTISERRVWMQMPGYDK
jgi:hypothetical protein